MMMRKAAKSSLGSGDEARRSEAALGGDSVAWPSIFLPQEAVRGRVPGPGESGAGAGIVSGSRSLAGACVEGGRAGRISSLWCWLPG